MSKLLQPLFSLLLLVLTFNGRAQDALLDSIKAVLPSAKEDTGKVNLLLQASKSYLSSEPASAIPFAEQALELATRLNFQYGIALAYKNIGIANYFQSRYVEALDYWKRSLAVFEKLGDKEGIANLQSNIGSFYKDQGNDAKALEYYFNSLRNSEETGDKLRITTALNNIGSVYQHKAATLDKALEYYLRAFHTSETIRDNDVIGTIAGNIGEIYLEKENVDSALFYFKKEQDAFRSTVYISYALNNMGKAYAKKMDYATALLNHQQAYDSALAMNSEVYQVESLQGMAEVYTKTGENRKALKALLQAEELSSKLNLTYDLKNAYEGLAETYAKLNDYSNAFKYQHLLLTLKDTIYNKEADLKVANYEFNFEIEKKEGKIVLLERDMELQAANIERQKLAKNAFIIGFGLILIIAFTLYRNYRIKVKAQKILNLQKIQIESLLLNILPAEVAKELQVHGHATPQNYESVSVMFTDFKGFTTIADKMSPRDLIEELNTCFMAFDEIIGKHNLEKIKTIGDSYMCAGGVPTPDGQHVHNIIKASLEIRDFALRYNQKRNEAGLESWDLRIGIHVGPVVTGVVGKKKYAYDIWGSTVNIASRMESNGMPGQVNISSSVYELVKHQYACSYRGKIHAKNIGEIEMYFVEGEIRIPEVTTESARNGNEHEDALLQQMNGGGRVI